MITLNIEQFKYLVEVTKTSSISAAAENLNITQPGLSKAISALEKEIGIPIFVRSRFGILPTIEGIPIIEKAKEVLEKIEELQDMIRLHASISSEQLSIAVTPLWMPMLTKWLWSFRDSHKETRIQLDERDRPEIIAGIKASTVDIGFIPMMDNQWMDPEIKGEVLLQSGIRVCVSNNSPLSQKLFISPEDLRDECIVGYNNENTKRLINIFCTPYGVNNIIWTTNNVSSIRQMVATESAVCMTFDISLHDDPYITSGRIRSLPFILNTTPVYGSIGWIYSKKRTPSKTTRDFKKFVQDNIVQIK